MKNLFFSLIFFVCLIVSPVRANILIKIPTRQRPAQFFKNLDIFYAKLSGKVPVHFLITCDIDDDYMNDPAIRKQLTTYKNLTAIFGNNRSKIAAYNSDIDRFIDWFDILVLASDDMEPVAQNYDQIIEQTMADHFPDFDGILHFNDGNMGPQCNVMPIIGKTYYQRFGYAYSPAYKSLWCDQELTEAARILKKEVYSHVVLIKHKHPGWGHGKWDELYVHNESFYKEDEEVFLERRKNNYYLDDALIEESCPKLWSILIYYDKAKPADYQRLEAELRRQIEALDLQESIEILSSNDIWAFINYYENSVLRKSSGKYISLLPAIYTIDPEYIQTIVDALQDNPDCVALCGRGRTREGQECYFEQSLACKEAFFENDVWYMPLNLLSPLKRTIATKCYFPHKYSPQKFSWEWGLLKSALIETEVRVGRCLIATA